MTKLQKSIYERYLKSETYNLRQCYETYSWRKEMAYERCCKTYTEKNGYRFRIIGYNSMQFSVGFIFLKDDVKYFHYQTRDNIKEWRVE